MMHVHQQGNGSIAVSVNTPTLRAIIVDGVVEKWEPRVPQPPAKGVGDHLHDIVLERTGNDSLGCGACREMIQKMNAWGPDGCEQHADEIIDHLLSQVDKLGKLTAMAVKYVLGGEWTARREARAMLDEAIGRARRATAQP